MVSAPTTIKHTYNCINIEKADHAVRIWQSPTTAANGGRAASLRKHPQLVNGPGAKQVSPQGLGFCPDPVEARKTMLFMGATSFLESGRTTVPVILSI